MGAKVSACGGQPPPPGTIAIAAQWDPRGVFAYLGGRRGLLQCWGGPQPFPQVPLMQQKAAVSTRNTFTVFAIWRRTHRECSGPSRHCRRFPRHPPAKQKHPWSPQRHNHCKTVKTFIAIYFILLRCFLYTQLQYRTKFPETHHRKDQNCYSQTPFWKWSKTQREKVSALEDRLAQARRYVFRYL